MPVVQPIVNEYQRVLRAATEAQAHPPTLSPLSHHIFRELPPYGQTVITEWGAVLYGKCGEIKAKTTSGLVTFYSRHPVLDWSWLQREHPDWICCPQCGRTYPKQARYWWVRNKARGYFWLDACRDCKCKTSSRWGERKRARLIKSSCSVQ
jgi:hypothetical protein